MLATALFTLLPLLPLAFTRSLDTPEIYFLTNCHSNATNASTASVAYYWDSGVAFDGVAPDKVGTISNSSAVDYQGASWTTLDSFRFTAYINASADSLTAYALAGWANAETYALPMSCYRDVKEVIYVNDAGASCESEYRCIDN